MQDGGGWYKLGYLYMLRWVPRVGNTASFFSLLLDKLITGEFKWFQRYLDTFIKGTILRCLLVSRQGNVQCPHQY